MKIKTVLYQHRRDTKNLYICEHCSYEEVGTGYDDIYFHEKVIPEMVCKQCGEKADDNYIPRETKYPDGMTI
ncbi:hypothetical protein LCGC14_2786180 [marine sediment metagenome]|uniref:Uncharacterized protein n=1 Tax=marine sediment metagenome TaxID=412755 RepID=A0A0F8YRV6_9ZZZZ